MVEECGVYIDTLDFIETSFTAWNMTNLCKCSVYAWKHGEIWSSCVQVFNCRIQIYTPYCFFYSLLDLSIIYRGMLKSPVMIVEMLISYFNSSVT